LSKFPRYIRNSVKRAFCFCRNAIQCRPVGEWR